MSGKAPPTGPRALRVNAQDQRQPRPATVPRSERRSRMIVVNNECIVVFVDDCM